MEKPLISVSLITYNHEKYISEAIQSVLNQTFENFELIIVNDGSTDRTEEIIQNFFDPRIKYIYQENMGPSAATNTALKNASGKFIALMSGDDVCYPQRLEVQYNHYIKGVPRFLFSWCDFIDDNSNIIEGKHWAINYFNHPNRNRYEILRYFFYNGNYINSITCFTEKEVFNKIGFFDIRLLQLQDFEMWIRTLFMGYELEIIQKKLIKYRIRANNQNLSAYRPESAERSLFEMKKIIKKFFQISDINLFKNIFHEFHELNINSSDIPLLLTRLCFEKNIYHNMYLAPEIIYDLIDENTLSYYKNKFNFSVREFYSLTGFGELFFLKDNLNLITTLLHLYHITLPPTIQLFYSSNGQFTEEESLKQNLELKIHTPLMFTFEFPKKQISHLRIDPLNERCIITFHKLTLFSEDSETLELKPTFHNALFLNGEDYCFETYDPQIYFEIPQEKRNKDWIQCKLEITYKHLGNEVLKWTIPYREEQLNQTRNELNQTRNELNQTRNELNQILSSQTYKVTKFFVSILRKLFFWRR